MSDFNSNNPLTSAEIYVPVDSDTKKTPANDVEFLEVRIALLDILISMSCNDDKSWSYMDRIGNIH